MRCGADPEPIHEIFDPPWLRRTYRRCLWDGGGLRRASHEFCSDHCAHSYAEWEERWRRQWELLELIEDPDQTSQPDSLDSAAL